MPRTFIVPLITSALLLLGGCGMKESFVPDETEATWPGEGSLAAEIVDVTYDGAQLENGQVLTREGILDVKIPEGYRFIGRSDGRVIAATTEGRVLLKPVADGNGSIELDLKKTVAGASVKGDTLAVLFADNDMALYSLETKAPVMKEGGSSAITVDNRIVNPYFFNDLVLFPTLDGKVVIIHAEEKKQLRSIIVSSEAHFNNIIYFKVIGNTIVAATPTTIFALSDNEARETYDLRDIVYTEEGIWLATKQGEIVALTPSLQLKAKQKFPFAHIIGMIVTDEKVFALEKEGYLIALDKDLGSYKVYDANVEEGYIFAGEKTFYFDSHFLPVE
jgi:outer membrane protein assembly factor BamB